MEKKCRDCIYWKPLNYAGGSPYACHFLLVNLQRRQRDEMGKCLEFKKSLTNPQRG